MDKHYLVIGAGPGIGFATARRFAREGFMVTLAARDGARLDRMADDLRREGHRADVAVIDAADGPALADLVRTQAPDVLHYNAAALRRTGIDGDTALFDADIAIGIGGALAASGAAYPAMRAKGGGTILLTGGGLSLQPAAQFLTLGMAKAALRNMAQALFEPARADNIHVATLTVSRLIAAASPEADAVADAVWALHAEDQAAWRWEATYDGNS